MPFPQVGQMASSINLRIYILMYYLGCSLAQCKHTTLQIWAPLRDGQPQNWASSLIGCDSRTQHAIGWSVEAEIVDTGSEKWLRVSVQVAGTEWTTSVGDDTTEVRVFFRKGTFVQSITSLFICGSTSGKDILSLTLGQTLFTLAQHVSCIICSVWTQAWSTDNVLYCCLNS